MNISITTLTPVHVGSGNLLHYNTDFFTATTPKGNRFIHVTDERKVLTLIGVENVSNWITSIERGQNIQEFVPVYAPNAKPADYSKRRILLFANVNNEDTLKECIHNGLGDPYIPGSSLKGALRTAITAVMAARAKDIDRKVVDRNGRLSSAFFEKSLFGSDPNHDIFRFLMCGDAYFRKGCEISFRLQMYLNLTHRDSLVPTSDTKPQVIEAIGTDESATFQMKVNSEYYQWIRRQMPDAVGNMPDEMQSLKSLFGLVNDHTLRLVNQEIDFWSRQTRTGAEGYVAALKGISNQIVACQNDGNTSCVLRVGHAIGWDFITGGWARQLYSFEEKVIPASRPGNFKYQEYPFPKSRRLDTDGEMIGFVKLSIQS